MGRTFQLHKDYYGTGEKLYKTKHIAIEPGVTVLVGCNGVGKTTLLHQIEDNLKKENIPCILFNNLEDGGHKSVSEACFYGDFSFMANAMASSEGENIVLNMEKLASRLGQFIKTGEDPKDKKFRRLAKAMRELDGDVVEEPCIPNERWILLDAVDSGLSVDNIVDIKEDLFNAIFEYNQGNVIYIVVSANEYEMARGEACFDVYNGKYIDLPDYETYRSFVLKSKEWKNKRINAAQNKRGFESAM